MKVAEKLFDPENPNNLIEMKTDCYYCMKTIRRVILIIIGICTIYIIGVYLTFGFIVAHPNHNRITGECPLDNPNCGSRLSCYKNNMSQCYVIGLPTSVAIVFLICILYLFCTCIFTMVTKISKSVDTAIHMVEIDKNYTNVESSDRIVWSYH